MRERFDEFRDCLNEMKRVMNDKQFLKRYSRKCDQHCEGKENFVLNFVALIWVEIECNYLRVKRAFDVACWDEPFLHQISRRHAAHSRPTVPLIELDHMKLFALSHWDAALTCCCE